MVVGVTQLVGGGAAGQLGVPVLHGALGLLGFALLLCPLITEANP